MSKRHYAMDELIHVPAWIKSQFGPCAVEKCINWIYEDDDLFELAERVEGMALLWNSMILERFSALGLGRHSTAKYLAKKRFQALCAMIIEHSGYRSELDLARFDLLEKLHGRMQEECPWLVGEEILWAR